MFGGINRWLFGPSRTETSAAVASYLSILRDSIPGETFPASDAIRDYEDLRSKHGWPKLDAVTLLREMEQQGLPTFAAIKVPWSNIPAPKLSLPAPEPAELRTEVSEASMFPEPEPPNHSVRQAPTVRPNRPNPAPRSTVRDAALAELIERLDRGEAIPSQQALAEAWGRSEGTVSDWLSAWRKAGFIPSPVREGKCNVLQLPRKAQSSNRRRNAA